MKLKSISEDTPLIPEIIADQVIAEARQKHSDLPEGLCDRLCVRAEMHYQQGKQFTRKIRSSKGREWLHAYMVHWLAAILIRGNFPHREIIP